MIHRVVELLHIRPHILRPRVALSADTFENARKNLETENPAWDFQVVKKPAEEAWSNHHFC